MSISLTKRPTATIQLGATSRWVCTRLPIVFEFQRQDFQVQSVGASGPNIVAWVNGNATGYQIGDAVYLKSGVYDGAYKVLNIIPGTTSAFVLQTPYIGNASGGYLNSESRRGYYVEVRVLKLVNNAWVPIPGSTATFHPDAVGKIRADLRMWLKSLVNLQDSGYPYTPVNWADRNVSGQFNIQYREMWTTKGTFPNAPAAPAGLYTTATLANRMYMVSAARQILQKYNGNMGEFVPFQQLTPIADPKKAKFLTAFKKPVYWPGYPFSLSFVYAETLGTHQIVRHEDTKNINAVVQASAQTNLDKTQAGYVNHLKLAGGYASGIHTVDVWLEYDAALTPGNQYVNTGYVLTGYISTAVPAPTQPSRQ